ncbi:MAG: fructose 1,6-bisphosphatase [Candidatus Aenigmatarchaeota archaeon]|nr:MAG: fructose 1,6-bisphosphatase [Candidatus Aenigmarchaeota archaeon]
MKVTVSLIKADVGSLVGHGRVPQEIIEKARECLEKAKEENLIIDFFVTNCGDDLELIMTHDKFIDNPEIHKLAFDTFMECANLAKSLKLYGAGQDLLKTAFSGNVKGMGPGVCEISFEERKSEPIVCFMADKTEPGAWNFPLFKIFADPFNTAGLIIDPKLHDGFTFEVHDVFEHKKIKFVCPQEMYDLLLYIGTPGRYCIKSVTRNSDGEIAAVSSTERLSLIAGKYVGKDDPACIVRCQSGFPAVGEVLEPFAFPYLVEGWMRGSHWGPFMPVSLKDAHPTRFDGPPRVIALGFQLNKGKLEGPVDLFDDPAFDRARQKANEIADYLRKHGPFEAHRLSLEAMEYTTLPLVEEKLKKRWEKI